VPIRYKINLSYNGKQEVHLRATWLFRIFKYNYNNTDLLKRGLRKFGSSDSGNKPSSKRQRKENISGLEKTVDEHESIGLDTADSSESASEQSTDRSKHSEKEYTSSEEKGSSLKENWDKFKSYPYKGMLISDTKLLMKRLIKPLKPKEFNLKCSFGFDDPSITGSVLGAAHAVCGIYGLYDHVSITADFEKKYLSYESQVIGKIRLWSLTWPFVVYSFSKPIWFFLKPLVYKAIRTTHDFCLLLVLRLYQKVKNLIYRIFNRKR
jgi:hypothetical protein